MDWRKVIVSDKDVLLGKPTIKGTRISVEHIVGLLAKGWTQEQLMENYPRLTPMALTAVFAFIQECMRDGMLYTGELENMHK